MKVVVMYDVSNDRARESLANNLQRLGLTRVQRSVFVGRANSQVLKDIERVVKLHINPSSDVVHIVPVDEGYWRRSKVLGTSYFMRRSRRVVEVVV